MTGSGDPAFTRNFNPFTGSVLNGGVHEGRVLRAARSIATVAGGGHVYPWLAQSWKWSERQQDADAADPPERQVVGRQAADRRRRRLQPDGRQAGQGAWTSSACTARARTSSRSSSDGPYGVAITLKTPDSQFIAANLNLQFVVPKHIWSKVAKPSTFTNSKPGRLRPVHDDHAVDDAGHRLRQEPERTGRPARRRSRASSTWRRPRTTRRCC